MLQAKETDFLAKVMMLVHTSGRQSRPSKSTDLFIDIMRVSAYLTVHIADHRDGLLAEVTRFCTDLTLLIAGQGD